METVSFPFLFYIFFYKNLIISIEILKKCDIIICKLRKFFKKEQVKFKIKYNKNKSKDNTNYIITFREPKEAENLVSKNDLLSPDCF